MTDCIGLLVAQIAGKDLAQIQWHHYKAIRHGIINIHEDLTLQEKVLNLILSSTRYDLAANSVESIMQLPAWEGECLRGHKYLPLKGHKQLGFSLKSEMLPKTGK